jgi:hypothetical protein
MNVQFFINMLVTTCLLFIMTAKRARRGNSQFQTHLATVSWNGECMG